MLSTAFLHLAILALSATAARLTVSIPSSQLLSNPATLPASTHAILLGPPGTRYDALLRRDNTFDFSHLFPASYLLTLHSRDYTFPTLRIDVSTTDQISAWQTFRGNEWSNKGPSYGSSSEDGSSTDELTIHVAPSGQKEYYQQRTGFSIISFLKSPMILMALVSVLMIVGLPYMMENMDPETKKEFEDMQSKGTMMGTNGAVNQGESTECCPGQGY